MAATGSKTFLLMASDSGRRLLPPRCFFACVERPCFCRSPRIDSLIVKDCATVSGIPAVRSAQRKCYGRFKAKRGPHGESSAAAAARPDEAGRRRRRGDDDAENSIGAAGGAQCRIGAGAEGEYPDLA